jgi:adenylosuccinate synthase
MIADVPRALYDAHKRGANLLFEGAQGTLLDIDHGTYPFVTSATASPAARHRRRRRPGMLHYVLGITKAYTTRVGGGPFPTELYDAVDKQDPVGKHMATKGHEFGATTGRARRCGWFDAAALKRAIQINGVSGLCVTKLDVLDGIEEMKHLHRLQAGRRNSPTSCPWVRTIWSAASRSTSRMPGWKDSTVGVKTFDGLPANAQCLHQAHGRACADVPVDMISTGPDREEPSS